MTTVGAWEVVFVERCQEAKFNIYYIIMLFRFETSNF
jgi:hypothetical protein